MIAENVEGIEFAEHRYKNRTLKTAGFRHTAQSEERFLSAQADAFTGANAEEKIGPLRSK
jgi:hypothetical protein